MSAAGEILARGGIQRAEDVVRIAASVGLALPHACTVLELESSGGYNVWGRDRGASAVTLGIYTLGGPVTEANYRAYRTALAAGKVTRQGVGPTQLTAEDYQAQADRLGGAHDPLINMRVGFATLAGHIRRYGVRGGFVAYNGGGGAVNNPNSPAQAYGDKSAPKIQKWELLLRGVSVSPDSTEDEDMPLSDDDIRRIWTYGIPDYYGPNLPAQPAFAMLGWAATHGANARDRAVEARDNAAAARDAAAYAGQVANALQAAVQNVAAPGTPVGDLDYPALARALLAAMASPQTSGISPAG